MPSSEGEPPILNDLITSETEDLRSVECFQTSAEVCSVRLLFVSGMIVCIQYSNAQTQS